jgi:hypothetical protein
MLHHQIMRALMAERLAEAEAVRGYRRPPERRVRRAIRKALGGGRATMSPTRPPEPQDPADLTIRFAYQEDAPAVDRLRQLSSKRLPSSPLLVAEVEGTIRAAVELAGVWVVADRSVPTANLVSLLRQRVLQLRGVPIPRALADRLLMPELPGPSWFERREPRRGAQ